MSVNDKKALSAWEENITQKDDSHYELAIPFKHASPGLPDNRQLAETLLKVLQKRLNRNTTLKKDISAYMQSLLDKGYAKQVNHAGAEGGTWYLPHHPTYHPKKPGKLRVVFDSAAKYQDVPLNDQVLKGPDLTNSPLGVLLLCRQELVALIGDIEAMFHQVRVAENDLDAFRILWWTDGDMSKNAAVYRMNVYLFGGTWNPSCNVALRRTSMDNEAA